jgi:hypothetical protein
MSLKDTKNAPMSSGFKTRVPYQRILQKPTWELCCSMLQA